MLQIKKTAYVATEEIKTEVLTDGYSEVNNTHRQMR
jgi:hypothetical protein